MSFHLAKCIDVTPRGTSQAFGKDNYLQMRSEPWSQELVDNVSHVRFWADFPSLWPNGHEPLGTGAGAFPFAVFDACIRKANEDGLKVIVVPYRYPRWVSFTHGFATTSDENLYRNPEDRCTLAQWLAFIRDPANPTLRNEIDRQQRDLEYEMPLHLPPPFAHFAGHHPESFWGLFVRELFERYVRRSETHGRLDYFEVVNEPNFQLWPQRSAAADPSWPTEGSPPGRFGLDGSRLVVQEHVAEMMETVDFFARQYEELYDKRVMCLAPSTADHDRTAQRRLFTVAVNTPWSTAPDPFTNALLDELERRRFKGGSRWIWSYHNYADMERDHAKAGYMRAALGKRWRGRTRDGGPAMMATEGGIRISELQERFGALPTGRRRRAQAAMLEAAFKRHRRSTGNGAGVELLTQYTVHADRNFDTGLRNLDTATTPRPSWDAWVGLKEFDAHDPLPSEWRPDDTFTPFDISTVD